MIFKLAEAAERSWRRLNGHNQLPKIILGVRFADGIEIVRSQLKPPPPDPLRHQDSAIARWRKTRTIGAQTLRDAQIPWSRDSKSLVRGLELN
jgi:hypothetical protein